MKLASYEAVEVLRDAMTPEAFEQLPYSLRIAGPQWLTAALVEGDGRGKLDLWLSLNPDAWEPMTKEETWEQVQAYGDPLIACRLVGEVLAKVPRPVSDYATTCCTFMAVGRETHGWCGSTPDLDGRPWLILLSGHLDDAAARHIIAHEIGHAWSLTPSSRGIRTAAMSAVLAARATAPAATVARFDAAHPALVALAELEQGDRPRRESIADRLAAQWGFSKPRPNNRRK